MDTISRSKLFFPALVPRFFSSLSIAPKGLGRSQLALLSSNTSLEDLILTLIYVEIADSDVPKLQRPLGTQPSLDMHDPKRIEIESKTEGEINLEMLLNPKLVLCADGWARSHHLRYMHLSASLPLAEIFPPNRQFIARVLSIRNNNIIGADGRSAISITILDDQAGNMLRYSLAAPRFRSCGLGSTAETWRKCCDVCNK